MKKKKISFLLFPRKLTNGGDPCWKRGERYAHVKDCSEIDNIFQIQKIKNTNMKILANSEQVFTKRSFPQFQQGESASPFHRSLWNGIHKRRAGALPSLSPVTLLDVTGLSDTKPPAAFRQEVILCLVITLCQQ